MKHQLVAKNKDGKVVEAMTGPLPRWLVVTMLQNSTDYWFFRRRLDAGLSIYWGEECVSRLIHEEGKP